MLILICWVHQQIVQKPTQEKKLKLTPQSKLVADHVAKLVHSAEALKGTKPAILEAFDNKMSEEN